MQIRNTGFPPLFFILLIQNLAETSMCEHLETEKILHAIKKPDIKLAAKLIASSSNVDALTPDGYSLILVSVLMNHYELVKALLNAGATPNVIYNPEGYEAQSISDVPHEVDSTIITDDLIYDIMNLANRIPLHAAVNNGYNKICTLLITSGADVNLKDPGGCTPLHWAAITGNLSMVKSLCDNHANVNEQDLALSTPHHEAVRKKKINVISLLLDYKADVTLVDITGQTPLDLARDNEYLYNQLLKNVDKSPDDTTHH